MCSTLQHMHQKKENVGVLGRLHMWHLQSFYDFLPPQSTKIVPDIASVDHLVIIAHEIYQYSPEFRFKKHAADVVIEPYGSKLLGFYLDKDSFVFIFGSLFVEEDDSYMAQLRNKQGLSSEHLSYPPTPLSNNQHRMDVFDVCSSDWTDDGVPLSAYKLMLSILNSDFKLAQQVDDHLSGSVRKAPTKFPRLCALLSLVDIAGQIASQLLKYIVFDDSNFSRPHSTANKYISIDFVIAARQAVKEFLSRQIVIDDRPVIYLDKDLVERAHIVFNYMESTTRILFNVSYINQINLIDQEKDPGKHLSRK